MRNSTVKNVEKRRSFLSKALLGVAALCSVPAWSSNIQEREKKWGMIIDRQKMRWLWSMHYCL